MNTELAEERARMSSEMAVAYPEAKAQMEQLLEGERDWRAQQLQEFREFSANAPRHAQAWSAMVAGAVLVIVVLGFVPWVYGLAVAGGVGLLALLASLVWRTGTPPNALAFFTGLLIVVASGIMIEGQVNPRPPAPVTLTLNEQPSGVAEPFASTSDDHTVSGRLVAVTDQAWYLSSNDPNHRDRMLTLARDQVAAGETTRVRRDVDSVVELTLDWLF